jgi:hypothetical protein
MRYEVLMALKMLIAVYCVVTLCSLVAGYQCFEEYLSSIFYPEDGDDKFLQKLVTTSNTTQCHNEEDHR